MNKPTRQAEPDQRTEPTHERKNIKIKSSEHYLELGYQENPLTTVTVASKNPGSWSNGIKVAIIDGKADVVYGSRFKGGQPHRVVYFWHRVGNGFLTLLSNIMTDINLTDMETCYKAFRTEVLKSINIKEKRFEPSDVKKQISDFLVKQYFHHV